MTDRYVTLTSGEIAAAGGQPAGAGRAKDAAPAIDAQLRAVIEPLDNVVAAARFTRCPDCKARTTTSCPRQGINCAAIRSGLAHLWSALGQADEAIVAAGLAQKETGT